MYHVYCSTSPTHFFPRVPEDMTFCLRLLPIKHLTSCMSGLGRSTGKVFTIVTALLIRFVLSDNLTKPYCEGLHWGKAYVLYLGHFLQWMREVRLRLSLLDMGPCFPGATAPWQQWIPWPRKRDCINWFGVFFFLFKVEQEGFCFLKFKSLLPPKSLQIEQFFSRQVGTHPCLH